MKNELPDWQYILFAVLFLLALGTVFVFSSTPMLESGPRIRFNHLGSVILGVGLMLWLMRLDYRVLRKHAYVLGLVAIILLAAVLFVGVTLNGATRWFRIGPMSFQPSEVAKVASIIFFADFFSRKQKRVKEFWNGFLPAVFYSGLVLALIMFEPDLGTTLLLGGVIFCMLLVAGFRLMHIFPSIVVVAFAAVPFLLRYPHVTQRLGTFFSGEYDHQVTQGLIALGSGGVTGLGLGNGMQKLRYVPLAWSDFAFALVGEEAGFIGCFLILVAYAVIVYFGFRIAMRCEDMFGKLLASGITLLIGGQALINLMVVTGLFPNKGIPLPFISAGGSAMVLLLCAMGLLLSVGKETHVQQEPELVGGKLSEGSPA